MKSSNSLPCSAPSAPARIYWSADTKKLIQDAVVSRLLAEVKDRAPSREDIREALHKVQTSFVDMGLLAPDQVRPGTNVWHYPWLLAAVDIAFPTEVYKPANIPLESRAERTERTEKPSTAKAEAVPVPTLDATPTESLVQELVRRLSNSPLARSLMKEVLFPVVADLLKEAGVVTSTKPGESANFRPVFDKPAVKVDVAKPRLLVVGLTEAQAGIVNKRFGDKAVIKHISSGLKGRPTIPRHDCCLVMTKFIDHSLFGRLQTECDNLVPINGGLTDLATKIEVQLTLSHLPKD